MVPPEYANSSFFRNCGTILADVMFSHYLIPYSLGFRITSRLLRVNTWDIKLIKVCPVRLLLLLCPFEIYTYSSSQMLFGF
jgi:hypothetical protein